MWVGRVFVEEVKAKGESALVTLRVPLNAASIKEMIACHLVEKDKEIITTIVTDFAGVGSIDTIKLAERANQTSYGQALGERIAGVGPKEKKA